MTRSIRLDSDGITLRLFPTERSAGTLVGTRKVARHLCGWVRLNEDGRWEDADGVLPPDWQPTAEDQDSLAAREAARS